MRYNWECIEESLHTRRELGQRILVAVFLVAKVCSLADFSSNALAFLFAITVIYVRHVLGGVIYAVPAETDGKIVKRMWVRSANRRLTKIAYKSGPGVTQLDDMRDALSGFL
jgi:hypothetical protein